MNKLNNPFLINVGFIVHESVGYSREFGFEVPSVRFHDDLRLQNLSGIIKVSRTSDGLLSQGYFKANHSTTCSRCLDNFEQELKTEFAELFNFNKPNVLEDELIYPDNGEIDFGPIIRDYFILEIQINPICNLNCKGLCPICGEKIIGDACEHLNDAIDPRFSILKSLLDQE
jgi:uncharacterized protein